LTPVFFFEVGIKSVGPLSHAADVQREKVVLFWRRRNGERMPFTLREKEIFLFKTEISSLGKELFLLIID